MTYNTNLDLYIRNLHNNKNIKLIEYLKTNIIKTKQKNILFNFYIVNDNELELLRKNNNMNNYPILVDDINEILIEEVDGIIKYINKLLDDNKSNKKSSNNTFRDYIKKNLSNIKIDKGKVIEEDQNNKESGFYEKAMQMEEERKKKLNKNDPRKRNRNYNNNNNTKNNNTQIKSDTELNLTNLNNKKKDKDSSTDRIKDLFSNIKNKSNDDNLLEKYLSSFKTTKM
tara:strand:+ start:890 stop:1570 length:681 start_codon:yes stop_codon:yes gene_type:complete